MISKVQNTKRQHIRRSLVTWNSKFNTVMPFKRFFSQGFTFRVARKKRQKKHFRTGPRSARTGAPWVTKFGYLRIQEIWFGQNRLSACPYAFRNRVSGCEMTDSLAIRWLVSHGCFAGSAVELIEVTCFLPWSADQLSAQVNKKSTVSPARSWIYVLMLDS